MFPSALISGLGSQLQAQHLAGSSGRSPIGSQTLVPGAAFWMEHQDQTSVALALHFIESQQSKIAVGGLLHCALLLAHRFQAQPLTPVSQHGKKQFCDSICKEIDAEDVGAMTLCGLLAAMDSAPTPDATSPMQLWNPSIPNPRNQARSASSGGRADSDSICKRIDADDVGLQ